MLLLPSLRSRPLSRTFTTIKRVAIRMVRVVASSFVFFSPSDSDNVVSALSFLTWDIIVSFGDEVRRLYPYYWFL